MQPSNLPPVSQEELVRRTYQAWERDPLFWGKVFFEKHFREKSPSFHEQLIQAAIKFIKLVIAAPRGSAKSTILAFIFPSHQIVFKKKRFILIISNTFKKAAMHLDTWKKELGDNILLREAFPPIVIDRDAEGDSIFRHQDGFQTQVLCKGVDQLGSIRGVKFRAYRPDLIIIDDLEDDELVKSPERRLELQEQFDEVLDQVGDKGTQFIMIGTVLHDDSQLAKMLHPEKYPEFYKITMRAHLNPDTPDESSLWPEKWTVEQLKELRRLKPNVYAKEMQNDPVAGVNARFKKDQFRYWYSEGDNYYLLGVDGKIIGSGSFKHCRAAVAGDLAWSEKRSADSSVLMPGFLTPNSDILIDNYVNKVGMRPDETGEHLFVMVNRLKSLTGSDVPVGFEKAMVENITQWLLKREMKKRNSFITIKPLVWDADKNTRIETRLEPRYNQGVIYHRVGMGDLEHQLLRFPYGTHDDLIDAEQGLVQLLQFPKLVKTAVVEDSQFMRARQLGIDARRPNRDQHKKNGNTRSNGVKFSRSFW